MRSELCDLEKIHAQTILVHLSSGRPAVEGMWYRTLLWQFSLQFRFPGWFWCSPGFIEWTMFFSAIRDPQWKPPSPSFRWSTCQPLDVVWPCPSPWPCCCLSDGAFLSSFLHLFNWTLLQNPVQVPSLDPWCLQLELLPSAPPCVSSLLLAHLFHQWVSERTAAFASHQPVALGMAVGSCFSSPGASGYKLVLVLAADSPVTSRDSLSSHQGQGTSGLAKAIAGGTQNSINRWGQFFSW